MSRLNLAEERIGTINKNIFGSTMKVVDYKNCDNILVEIIGYEKLISTRWLYFIKGSVRSPYCKTVFKTGFLGEGKYDVGNNGRCLPVYDTWSGIIKRGYSEKYKEKHPTYKNVTVCDEWYSFQNFAEWYYENYYQVEGQRMELDKDILVKGNKVYSPDTCVFVPQRINALFIKQDAKRGDFPIGVTFDKSKKKFVAQCNDGKGKYIKLGTYDNPDEAFYSYKTFKENLIKEMAAKYKEKIPTKLYRAMQKYQVDIED